MGIELVNDLMSKAKTTTDLRVFSHIISKTFETGRKVADNFKDNMRIQFDEYLPQWNHLTVPEEAPVSHVINTGILSIKFILIQPVIMQSIFCLALYRH